MVLLQNKIPMLAINTELNCYRDFLKTGAECSQVEFSNEAECQTRANKLAL
ncbi:hypothetical protein JCM19232_4080 [Vibrio ishigakensis]|uniref:Uncharacterized protein n=1 Tax=Vibrio ishigakensis TaxID=1481914 RepID=A0A0B8PDA1_9VIBR|nr:hypothetical protein JCM19232_4080 [Vibrio ishigakensis]